MFLLFIMMIIITWGATLSQSEDLGNETIRITINNYLRLLISYTRSSLTAATIVGGIEQQHNCSETVLQESRYVSTIV